MNRTDFLVDNAVLKEAKGALDAIPGKYQDAISRIRSATDELLDKNNWKGETRDEFKDTYDIVSRYLEDDQQQIASIVEILEGFYNVYEAADVDTMKSLVEGIGKLAGGDESSGQKKK